MICRDIESHFHEVGPYINWDKTTDRFKAGDPDREVTTIAVGWKPTWDALKEAHERGAELFVSHESLAVRANNMDPEPERKFALPTEEPKFNWLDETGLVVFRNHDLWDRFPEIGVRWTWRQRLFGGDADEDVVGDGYPLVVTRIEPRPLQALADHVLEKVKPLGQNGILMMGDPEQEVSRVATGTGVTTDPVRMRELGADTGILTDDYFLHVRMGAHALELGFPTLVVNHGVAEEWAIEEMANYLDGKFPDLNIFHIPQRCAFTVVT